MKSSPHGEDVNERQKEAGITQSPSRVFPQGPETTRRPQRVSTPSQEHQPGAQPFIT